MAGEEARAPTAEDALDEEGHYFDFIGFYRKVEVCDRSIRLEILAESNAGSGTTSECEDIPVSSIVIAAKSLVLQKMIFAGMQESDEAAPMTIKVTAEEKEAFKQMLHFLYAGSLAPRFDDPATDVRELVRLLVVGDKFEVPSLMGAILKCLNKREKSISECAVLVNQVPETLFRFDRVKRLADEACAHIVKTFKDVSETWKSEAFDLSVNPEVIEILLQSEELEADSEDEILEKTLIWIIRSYQSESDRRRVFSKLSPHIRFFSLDGEYLEVLLGAPEMQLGPTQRLIKDALRFQAYSDPRKEEQGEVACQRKGVRDVHLEIISDFVLDQQGTTVRSRSALWFGKRWFIEVVKEEGESTPTVGASDAHAVATCRVDHVEVTFYAKVFPDSVWKFLATTEIIAFSLAEEMRVDNWGYDNALGVSWEEARRSERFLNSTGAIMIKVVARRFRSSEN